MRYSKSSLTAHPTMTLIQLWFYRLDMFDIFWFLDLFSFVAAGQVNKLQCCCFLSLAMAAFSFHCRAAWFSRLALVLPFLLSAALCTLTPDSAESLAMRLWKDRLDPVGRWCPGMILEFELCCQWWDLCHLGIYQGYSLLENHCAFPMFVEPPKLGLMMHVSWIHGYGIWSRILRPRQSGCSGASNCGCTLPDVSFPGLIIWSSYSYYLLEDPGKVRSCLSRSAGMALYCS